jgi:hypothetical protein
MQCDLCYIPCGARNRVLHYPPCMSRVTILTLHTTGNASARAHADSWMCNSTLVGVKISLHTMSTMIQNRRSTSKSMSPGLQSRTAGISPRQQLETTIVNRNSADIAKISPRSLSPLSRLRSLTLVSVVLLMVIRQVVHSLVGACWGLLLILHLHCWIKSSCHIRLFRSEIIGKSSRLCRRVRE